MVILISLIGIALAGILLRGGPMAQALTDIGSDAYNAGSRVIKAAAYLILSWTFVLVGTAMMGWQDAVIWLAFVPALLLLVVVVNWPVEAAALAYFGFSRRWLAGIVVGELILGLYLWLVPIGNGWNLIPVVGVAVMILGLLKFGGFTGPVGGKLQQIAVLAIVFVSILFFVPSTKASGRARVGEAVEKVFDRVVNGAPKALAPQSDDVRFSSGGVAFKRFTYSLDPSKPSPWLFVETSRGEEWQPIVQPPVGYTIFPWGQSDPVVVGADGFVAGTKQVPSQELFWKQFRIQAHKPGQELIVEIRRK